MMNVLNLMYELKANKVYIWKNTDGNLSFSFDVKIGFCEHFKDTLKNHKAQILEILIYNNIQSEEQSKKLTVYRVPEGLQGKRLSVFQVGVYVQSQLDSVKYTYNLPFFLKVNNNTILLKKVLEYFLTKHEIFRMSVCGDFKYKILDPNEIAIEEHELDEDAIESWCHTATKEIEFNLEGSPLVRVAIIRIKNTNSCVLSLIHHHMITDDYSLKLITSEIVAIYTTLSTTDKLQSLNNKLANYFDYIVYQNYLLQTASYQEIISYLSDKLARSEPLQLRKTKQIFDNQGDCLNFEIDYHTYNKLIQITLENDVSLYSILLTSLYHVLSIYVGNQTNFPILLTVSNRPVEFNEVIGPFISTLPLIPEYKIEDSFIDNLHKVHKDIILLNEYQHINLNLLTEKLQHNNQNIQDLMHVMFTMLNSKYEAKNTLKVDYEIINAHEVTEKFGISVIAEANSNGLNFCISYAKSLYQDNYIKAIFSSFITLLSTIDKTTIKKPVSLLSLLNREDYNKVINIWNQTEQKYPKDKTINQLFEEQVERTPDNIAVVYEDKKLTYKQLNLKANQLAHYLKANFEIKPDTLIALCLDKSEHMLVAILAVLKAGAAYVPMDPEYPDERIKYILEDTAANVVLTNEKNSVILNLVRHCERKRSNPEKTLNISDDWIATSLAVPRNDNILIVDTPEFAQQLSLYPFTNPITTTTSSNLAYVIYTSGTTGNPKGVMIEHTGVVNLSLMQANEFGLTGSANYKNCLWYASCVFDAHVWELYATILHGHTIHIINNDIRQDIKQLSCYVENNNIYIATIPPILLDNQNFLKLQVLVVAGASTNQTILDYYFSKKVKVINAYGPTETTVCASLNHYKNNGAANIGRPITNMKCYVLDNALKPLPIGAIGELYIGGVGIARGYLNRPELTAAQFVPNPFGTCGKGKLYKTGDLVRWLPNGNLEYIGRNDTQAKIRGYRIELSEIETALLNYQEIKQAAVLVKESGNQSDKYLVAFYVAANKQNIQRLLDLLQKQLPDYMVPKHFVYLDTLPLTVNGKLDTKKLLSYATETANAQVFIRPTTEVERLVAHAFTDVLGRDNISIYDNFFDLGGNSILLVKMFALLPDSLKHKIKLMDLFKYPSISAISNFITRQEIEDVKQNTCAQAKRGLIKEIAIVGMAGRFPAADNIQQLWKNLKAGLDSTTFYSKEELAEVGIDKVLLDNPHYVRAQSVLKNIKGFDPEFFGYSPAEAVNMDPQHRLFLMCAWEALENAGYMNNTYTGKIGIYAGAGNSSYWHQHIAPTIDQDDFASLFQLLINNDSTFLATKVAYKLNLTGPAIGVQTACSTSLVAVHQACSALQLGDCDMALAGGVSLGQLEKGGYLYQPGMILSPDGRCRAFDEGASGTTAGQGVGIVVLKPLEQAMQDNDHIYAVIKASAINNDGHDKIGYTAPSELAQAAVIKLAQEKAQVPAETITYIEAHGTGTNLGDPIEMAALTMAFDETTKKHYCAIGSIKTNIGHLDTAAGVVGLIKTALCLYHKTLVPSLHYSRPNPKINFVTSPFYVNTELKEWASQSCPRRAGVSSFGIGGTNAHVVLEEVTAYNDTFDGAIKPYYLIALSAKTQAALEQKIIDLEAYIDSQILAKDNTKVSLPNISYTLNTGRSHFAKRCALVVSSFHELQETLQLIKHRQLPDNYLSYDQVLGLSEQKYDPYQILAEISNYQELDAIIYRSKLLVLAEMYVQGRNLDWELLHQGELRQKLPLPTYPFAKTQYWRPAASSLPQNALVSTKFPAKVALASGSDEDLISSITIIWQQLFKLPNIDKHNDFFDLGGDSLMAVQLASQIKKQLGVIIDIASLENLTINELAKVIRNQAGSHNIKNNYVVLLKQGNSAKLLPLVLIHPVGGDVYFYRDLVQGLHPDQTVYAVRSPMLDGKKIFTSIVEMAEDYINALLEFGVKSPYILGGSSFGGTVAYQMAHILHARGEKVPFVVGIDPPAPGHLPKILQDTAAILEYILKHSLNKLQISADELRNIGGVEQQIQYITDKTASFGKEDTLLFNLNASYINTWQIHQKIMIEYTAPYYNGSIAFFSPTDQIAELPPDQYLHWQKMVTGEFKNFYVPGNHLSMNQRPNVDIIAQNLRTIIAQESYRKLVVL